MGKYNGKYNNSNNNNYNDANEQLKLICSILGERRATKQKQCIIKYSEFIKF